MKIPAILSWRFRDQDCYVRTAGAPYALEATQHNVATIEVEKRSVDVVQKIVLRIKVRK